ncbi:MAG TPA: hypothetical protein DCX03_00255, partial [Bacteroidales bacterium]|nr:hypothetical protein [Bacteroidales bacterium]
MVEKFRNPLRAAYSGYIYQDLLIAYIFTKGLIHRYSSITVDRKQVEDDRIDDVEIVYAGKRVKRQIKSSEDEERYISVKDFTDKESSLRIDRLVKTYVQAGDSAADEYRLCTTWKISLSNDNFSEFVEPIQLEPTVTGSQSQTFRLLTEKIWPLKERPMWKYLENEVTRDQFLLFCERFAIEVNLPPASRTLHSPGILEGFLVDMMSKNVGIGKYPNQGRQAVDVAALLLSQATSARAEGETLTPQDIETRLNLRTDYGRIAQAFPLDESVFQNRKDLRPILSENALKGMHQILIGMPGAGKSWELTKLANELENSGVLVARHYCYLEPGDDLVERRITSEVLFGNLMADLADAEPSIADSPLRRYSAGAEEFQAFLVKISEMHRKAVVIVDGLDHIARVLKQANSLTSEETDIIGELAT